MFKLLRRLSSSVFPRNDRPWADDATSTAPTIGMKRRLSSVDMDLDTPVGSLSKKSKRGKDADVSDDEEPASSPVTSSPLPPKSSPPPEDVKEVTTGVKEIELDQKPDVPLSDPSEVVEPPATLVAEPSVEANEQVKTDTEEGSTPEQRSGEGNALEVEGSQDHHTTDEIPVKPVQEPTYNSKDTTKASEEAAKCLSVDPASASPTTVVSRPKSTVEEPVASDDELEADA
ncbi:hypothetical protein BDM02DRAFT_3182681 [Thelephora ganbajun]|uniref:Uncharacterized protein n=1 Tax=Thelephora ganbajun TaxID=370292 RepID=A0ACB6ZW22_THEGA|nr:hypothetical protein BDM02DRAFT_3182681 [Thelephora ganbajun]